MKACKRINFEELDGDELHFANSWKREIGNFGGSIFLGPSEVVSESTPVSVEELLDLVKSHVENGSVAGERQEESGPAEPRASSPQRIKAAASPAFDMKIEGDKTSILLHFKRSNVRLICA